MESTVKNKPARATLDKKVAGDLDTFLQKANGYCDQLSDCSIAALSTMTGLWISARFSLATLATNPAPYGERHANARALLLEHFLPVWVDRVDGILKSPDSAKAIGTLANLLGSMLRSGMMGVGDAPVGKSFGALATLVSKGPKLTGEAIGLCLSSLKTYVDMLPGESKPAAIATCFANLVTRISSAEAAGTTQLSICNCFVGIKAGLDKGFLVAATPKLDNALVVLTEYVAGGALKTPNAIDVCNVFSGLKSGIDFGLLNCQAPKIQAAHRLLISQVAGGVIKEGGPLSFGIAFIGLKDVLENEIIQWNDGPLQKAFAVLVADIADGAMAGAHITQVGQSLLGLKVGLERCSVSIQTPKLRDACAVLLNGLDDADVAQGNAYDLGMVLVGLKGALSCQAIAPTAPALAKNYSAIIARIAKGALLQGSSMDVAMTFTGIKAGLDFNSINAKTPNISAAIIRLIDMVKKGVISPANVRGTCAVLVGLRAARVHSLIDDSAPGFKEVFAKLLESVQGYAETPLNGHDIGNTLVGLKAGLEARSLDPASAKLKKVFLALLKRMTTGDILKQPNALDVRDCLNGIKTAIDFKIIEEDAPEILAALMLLVPRVALGMLCSDAETVGQGFNGLRTAVAVKLDPVESKLAQAFRRQTKRVADDAIFGGNPQAIGNCFSGLKSGLDAGFLDASMLDVKRAFASLIKKISVAGLSDGELQNFSNCFVGLKDGLRYKILTADTIDLKSVFVELVARTAAKDLDNAEIQSITGILNGLAAALRERLVDAKTAQIGPLFSKLVKWISLNFQQHAGDRVAVGDMFKGLKAGLDASIIDRKTAGVGAAYDKLLKATTDAGPVPTEAKQIGYLLTGIKAAIDSRVMKDKRDKLREAYAPLIGCVVQGGLANGNYLDVSQCFSGLKSGIDAQALDKATPQLAHVYEILCDRVAAGVVKQGDAQTVGVCLTGLKAALDSEVITAIPPVQAAFVELIGLVAGGKVGPADRQALSNSINGLSAGITAQAIGPDTPNIDAAYAALIHGLQEGLPPVPASQHVGNFLNGIRTALNARILDASSPGVSTALESLLTLVGDGLMDADPQGVGNAIVATASCVYLEVIKPDDPTLRRALARLGDQARQMAKPDAGPIFLSQASYGLCRHVSLGCVELAATWPVVIACVTALVGKPFVAEYLPLRRSISGLDQLFSFIKAKRLPSGKGTDYRAEVRKAVGVLMGWAGKGISVQKTWGETSKEICGVMFSLEHLRTAQRRRGTAKPESVLAKFVGDIDTFQATMAKVLDPAVASALKGEDSPGLSASEAALLSRHLKRDITPAYKVLTPEQMNHLMEIACKTFDVHPPKSIENAGKFTVPVIDMATRTPLVGVLNHSIYHRAFPYEPSPNYILLKLRDNIRPEKLPLFWRYEKQVYRMDVFGGSKLKPDRKEADPGTLIGVPLEASDFFAQKWFTSDESFCYGQRAFMPLTPKDPTLGLEGRFDIALIPDASQEKLFPPMSAWGALRTMDGFGFVHQDLAEAMKLDAKADPADARDVGKVTGALSYQALQYYPTPADDQSAKTLVAQAVASAQAKLDPLINAWSDADAFKKELANPRFANNGLYYTLTHGAPLVYNPTAIPTSGDNLLVPDAKDWKAAAANGMLIGRNPYDTTNLIWVPRNRISSNAVLAKSKARQYSLTGYVRDKKGVCGRFMKGLFMVVPREMWPDNYKDARILLSTKDLKMDSFWICDDDKKAGQSTAANFTLYGCLVIKDERIHVVGVPKAIQDSLAGDYDGDEVNLMPYAHWPELAEQVKRTPKLDNPKMDKLFHRRTSPGNSQKITEMRMELLQAWVGVAGLWCAIAPQKRLEAVKTLAPQTSLPDVLGEKWAQQVFGPAVPKALLAAPAASASNDLDDVPGVNALSAQEMERIVLAEISIGIKAGTDAEKTTVPIAVLKPRADEVRSVLQSFGVERVPYSGGFRDRLRETLNSADARSGLVRKIEQARERSQHIYGIPAACMYAITDWTLGQLQRTDMLAGGTLAQVCDALGAMPSLASNPNYRRAKLESVARALKKEAPKAKPVSTQKAPSTQAPQKAAPSTPLVKDGELRLSDIQQAVEGMSDLLDSEPAAAAALAALAERVGPIAASLYEGLAEAQAGMILANIIASLWGSLTKPVPDKQALRFMAALCVKGTTNNLLPTPTNILAGQAPWTLGVVRLIPYLDKTNSVFDLSQASQKLAWLWCTSVLTHPADARLKDLRSYKAVASMLVCSVLKERLAKDMTAPQAKLFSIELAPRAVAE